MGALLVDDLSARDGRRLVWCATMLYACAPFAIAYAVVRQRVFDISFVISRTLVYTILTGTIFALFAFIEWLAARLIEQSGVTIVLVALTAIGVAFSLEAAHAKDRRIRRSARSFAAATWRSGISPASPPGFPTPRMAARVDEALASRADGGVLAQPLGAL